MRIVVDNFGQTPDGSKPGEIHENCRFFTTFSGLAAHPFGPGVAWAQRPANAFLLAGSGVELFGLVLFVRSHIALKEDKRIMMSETQA